MLVRRGRQFAIGVSAFAGVVSTVVLLGWMLDSALLVSVIPGAAKMMPNTAIGFILVAHALWYRSVAVAGTRPAKPWHTTVADVCAGLAALVGLVTLVEYLAGFDLGIDTLLFRGRLVAARGDLSGPDGACRRRFAFSCLAPRSCFLTPEHATGVGPLSSSPR